MPQHRLKLMRSVWQKFKILQEINYAADRQERSFEIRTSLSRGTFAGSNVSIRKLPSCLNIGNEYNPKYIHCNKENEDIPTKGSGLIPGR